MERPHEPVVEGERLYGRGAYDMKAGLAAIMLAGAWAAEQPLRGDVIVTAVADEENASFGTAGILKRWTADAAIVTEPTELKICVAHKGFVWLEAATIGKAAHGSRPNEGVDAIAKMGRVLVELEELDRRLRARPTHRLLKSGSVHASLITGGQERSSYPERCLLDIERRTIPGETGESVEAEVRAILDALAASDPRFRAELRVTLVREPFEVAEDAEIVKVLRRAAAGALGTEPEIVGETPWMDAALISAAGIPTVVFGPGGAGAHAVVEWSDLRQVGQCVEVLCRVVGEFC
jgi:acetylornithine deacetylase